MSQLDHPSMRAPLDASRLLYSDWRVPQTTRQMVGMTNWHAALPEPVKKWRKANFHQVSRGWRRHRVAKKAGAFHFVGSWFVDVITSDGEKIPYGLASMDMVTDDGALAVVEAFSGGTPLSSFRYLGAGTGTTAPASTQHELVAEVETLAGGQRASCSVVAVPGSPEIFKLQGNVLNIGDDPVTIAEMGIFSDSGFGAGVMLDRAATAHTLINPFGGISLTFALSVIAG